MKKMSMIFAILLTLAISMPVSLSLATVPDSGKDAVQLMEKINVNSSSVDLLTSVPGIGPKTAEKITEYREKNGKFISIDDLLNVKGIGSKSLEKLKPYLTL